MLVTFDCQLNRLVLLDTVQGSLEVRVSWSSDQDWGVLSSQLGSRIQETACLPLHARPGACAGGFDCQLNRLVLLDTVQGSLEVRVSWSSDQDWGVLSSQLWSRIQETACLPLHARPGACAGGFRLPAE